jgi:hypothetical protein
MPSVKRVMQEANPVRNDRIENQGGADALLADLLGSEAANALAGTRPVGRATSRRRALVWAAAGLAAVVAAGVVGVVVWQGAAPPPPAADEPFFATTERLEGRAESIVRVRLGVTRATSQDGIDETVATAQVQRTAKGGLAPGSALKIFYTTPGSGPETPAGLKRNGEYVLLLEKRDATSWNLVNTTQGYYVVGAAGKLTATPDNPVDLSPSTRQLLGVS